MRPFRLLVAVLVALGVSTPVAAQFKKLKRCREQGGGTKGGPVCAGSGDLRVGSGRRRRCRRDA